MFYHTLAYLIQMIYIYIYIYKVIRYITTSVTKKIHGGRPLEVREGWEAKEGTSGSFPPRTKGFLLEHFHVAFFAS